jgi:hypothetical protein
LLAIDAAAEGQGSVWFAFFMDDGENDRFLIDNIALTAVPIPAARPLFISAIVGMGLLGRRRRQQQTLA